tara:strand:- start:560 stop:796 length:237 start_codon:yes stop_codon:yes gene_type:complete
MFENTWNSSKDAAKELGIQEYELSNLREYGFFKPGIHWRSAPLDHLKPWSPEAIYNSKLCRKVINKMKLKNEFNKYAA